MFGFIASVFIFSIFFFCFLSIPEQTNVTICPVKFDSVLCWPETPAGTLAIMPCFSEFQGLNYDSSRKWHCNWSQYSKNIIFSFILFVVFSNAICAENATRYCHPNGTWEIHANFDQCIPQMDPPVHDYTLDDVTFYVYCIGYILSLISLSFALIVFVHFKWVIHSKKIWWKST